MPPRRSAPRRPAPPQPKWAVCVLRQAKKEYVVAKFCNTKAEAEAEAPKYCVQGHTGFVAGVTWGRGRRGWLVSQPKAAGVVSWELVMAAKAPDPPGAAVYEIANAEPNKSREE